MDPDLKHQIDAAAANLAEAFHQWHKQANMPEQDLDMQRVSDAWDLLIVRDEQYKVATDNVRAQRVADGDCVDCPDEHEHTQRTRDA